MENFKLVNENQKYYIYFYYIYFYIIFIFIIFYDVYIWYPFMQTEDEDLKTISIPYMA